MLIFFSLVIAIRGVSASCRNDWFAIDSHVSMAIPATPIEVFEHFGDFEALKWTGHTSETTLYGPNNKPGTIRNYDVRGNLFQERLLIYTRGSGYTSTLPHVTYGELQFTDSISQLYVSPLCDGSASNVTYSISSCASEPARGVEMWLAHHISALQSLKASVGQGDFISCTDMPGYRAGDQEDFKSPHPDKDPGSLLAIGYQIKDVPELSVASASPRLVLDLPDTAHANHRRDTDSSGPLEAQQFTNVLEITGNVTLTTAIQQNITVVPGAQTNSPAAPVVSATSDPSVPGSDPGPSTGSPAAMPAQPVSNSSLYNSSGLMGTTGTASPSGMAYGTGANAQPVDTGTTSVIQTAGNETAAGNPSTMFSISDSSDSYPTSGLDFSSFDSNSTAAPATGMDPLEGLTSQAPDPVPTCTGNCGLKTISYKTTLIVDSLLVISSNCTASGSNAVPSGNQDSGAPRTPLCSDPGCSSALPVTASPSNNGPAAPPPTNSSPLSLRGSGPPNPDGAATSLQGPGFSGPPGATSPSVPGPDQSANIPDAGNSTICLSSSCGSLEPTSTSTQFITITTYNPSDSGQPTAQMTGGPPVDSSISNVTDTSSMANPGIESQNTPLTGQPDLSTSTPSYNPSSNEVSPSLALNSGHHNLPALSKQVASLLVLVLLYF